MTETLNTSIKLGQWQDTVENEAVTPTPKVSPPSEIGELRSISELNNLNKVAEKLLAKMILKVMKA